MSNNDIKITIFDYEGNPTIAVLNSADSIERIEVHVLSGDEVLYIYRTDGSLSCVDSSFKRCEEYFDYWYPLYSKHESIDLLNDDRFINRKTTYEMNKVAAELFGQGNLYFNK